MKDFLLKKKIIIMIKKGINHMKEEMKKIKKR